MSQKSSLLQSAEFVSKVLMVDTLWTRPIVHEQMGSKREGATIGTRRLALPRTDILDR
jgi:hypothetical protein